MRAGVILACHNKVDDCAAHLDILKFHPYVAETVLVCTSGDLAEAHPGTIAGRPLVRIPSPGFALGPLVSFVAGLRRAAALGLDYVIYRNADDWTMNAGFVSGYLAEMAATGAVAAGYNWFTQGTMRDITMHELAVRVDAFLPSAGLAEEYFRKSKRWLCEFKMACWVRHVMGGRADRFLRLPGREMPLGVGTIEAAEMIEAGHYRPRGGEAERLRHNSRFFNRDWQMLGFHDNAERLRHYEEVRPEIPYAPDLEAEPEFARWLAAARSGADWNRSSAAPAAPENPPRRRAKPTPRRLMVKAEWKTV